jgi:hypothetical protein
MDASEIKDKETLELWLRDRPREDAICIAQRAALRVFPLWAGAINRGWAREGKLTALPGLRSLQISGVTRRYPTAAVRTAADSAAPSVFAALAARAFESDADRAAADAAGRAAVRASAAAFHGAPRADAASCAADGAAAFSGTARAEADADANAAAAAFAATWTSIRADAFALQSGTDPLTTPLWPVPPPESFTQADTRARAIWAREPDTWAFWLRWWDGMLAGRPLDWDLQQDVALIPDDDWQKGPAHIAAIIRDIELRHAIAATPNGETIEVNPDTGRLRLVPVTDLPEDIATYARRKIRRALGLFGEAPGNQYAALRDDLAMLRDVVEDAEATPVELFDTCASASRRLTLRASLKECPSPAIDPVIADYETRVREVGADILANDAQTQAVLSKRKAVTGSNVLIEGRTVIVSAAQVVVTAAEGRLATTLSGVAETATDPKANSEDRQRAAYVLASRILRVARIVGIAAAGAVGTAYAVVLGTKEVLEAIPAIHASPHFQETLAFVLRYLNF